MNKNKKAVSWNVRNFVVASRKVFSKCKKQLTIVHLYFYQYNTF